MPKARLFVAPRLHINKSNKQRSENLQCWRMFSLLPDDVNEANCVAILNTELMSARNCSLYPNGYKTKACKHWGKT